MLAYGHYGRPLLVFPSEQGHCNDYEDRMMIASMAHLIDSGRLKVYCVDSFDAQSWQDKSVPLEERARRHGRYEEWIIDHVVPWILDDCGGSREIMVTGCSFGAYHAANFALKRADLFPVAICQSGVYDVSAVGWGERGDATYFNNPMDYVHHLEGDHLDVVCATGSGSCWFAAKASGRTRPARSTPRKHSPGFWLERGYRTSSISGGTTSLMTGLRGGTRSPTTCLGSVRSWGWIATSSGCSWERRKTGRPLSKPSCGGTYRRSRTREQITRSISNG